MIAGAAKEAGKRHLRWMECEGGLTLRRGRSLDGSAYEGPHTDRIFMKKEQVSRWSCCVCVSAA